MKIITKCFSQLKRHIPLLSVFLSLLFVPLLAGAFSHELDVEVSLDVGDTVLTVEGKTAPDAFVTIMDNGTTIGTTTSNGNGGFAKSFPSQQSGIHNIKVFAKMNNGEITDTVTKNVNLVNQAETTVKFFLPTTLNVSSNTIVRGGSIVFQGSTVPGSKVTIIIDNNLTYNATANNNGRWLHAVTTSGFYIGTHYVYAVVSDQHGNQSAPTTKQAFEVVHEETRTIVDERGETPSYIQPPVATSLRNNQHFSDTPIEVRGVAVANSQVEIWEDGVIIGSVFANHTGQWSFLMRLFNPRHDVMVRVCLEGVCSEFSDTLTIYFDGAIESTELLFSLGEYRYFDIGIGQPIALEMFFNGSEPPYELVLDWGDNAVETLTIERKNDARFRHIYTEAGNYTGIVTLKDAGDKAQSRYFSVEVRAEDEDGLPPLAVLVAIAAASALGGGCLFMVFRRLLHGLHGTTGK